MLETFTVRENGDHSLLLDIQPQAFPADTQLSTISHAMADALRQAQLPYVLEVVPTTQALMVVFNAAVTLKHPHCQTVLSLLSAQAPSTLLECVPSKRTLSIPVCYEMPHAVDLADMSRQTQLAEDDIIRLHTDAAFFVDMLGFLPGFAYLSGLPKPLQIPRKDVPALRVDRGSVGVAFNYCGLYPQASPGGWTVIGRTPLRLFDYRKPDPTRLLAGDAVRFSAIDSHEFDFLFNAEYADVIDDS